MISIDVCEVVHVCMNHTLVDNKKKVVLYYVGMCNNNINICVHVVHIHVHVHVCVYTVDCKLVSPTAKILKTLIFSIFSYQQRIHHYRIIPNEDGVLSIQVSERDAKP